MAFHTVIISARIFVYRLLSDERQRLLDHDDISDNSTFSTSGFHTNAEVLF